MTEKEKQNREELFRLMQENPDLPVVPMVYYEVVYDDNFECYLGSWGKARIDEYLITDSQIWFKSDDNVFDVLEETLSYEDYSTLPSTEDEYRPIYDELPWVKAIIVNIDLPN